MSAYKQGKDTENSKFSTDEKNGIETDLNIFI